MTAALAALLLLADLAVPPAGFQGADTTPPSFTIESPARGEFVSGDPHVVVRGKADDTGSGVKSVEVNGQPATLSGSDWTAKLPLRFGTNTFTLRVVDNAGNEAHTSWSVLYSPSYLPASELVPDAIAVALGPAALGGLADRIARLVELPGMKHGKPELSLGLTQGGLDMLLTIHKISAGAPLEFRATSAIVKATVAIDPKPLATRIERLEVTLAGYGSRAGTPQKVAEASVAEGALTALPGAIEGGLAAVLNPRPTGGGADAETLPRARDVAPSAIRESGDANVTRTPSPTAPPTPGSVLRQAPNSTPPAFPPPVDLAVALREDFLNRALHAAWQAGFWNLTIDQAFLDSESITLPFQLDASFLVPFFPALAALNPGGGPMPVAFELDAKLPPVVEVTGAPSLLAPSVGELHVAIRVDPGGGYQDVLTLVLHAEMGTDVTIAGGRLRIDPGEPTRVSVDLLANPLGLSLPDVDRFIQSGIPQLVVLATLLIPAMPLPPLPHGLPPQRRLDFRQDGAAGDYVTIEVAF